jgi:hypothetical protein
LLAIGLPMALLVPGFGLALMALAVLVLAVDRWVWG